MIDSYIIIIKSKDNENDDENNVQNKDNNEKKLKTKKQKQKTNTITTIKHLQQTKHSQGKRKKTYLLLLNYEKTTLSNMQPKHHVH